MSNELATAVAFFRALANQARLRIVGLLAEQELTVHDLASRLDLTSPTVSHHLGKLRELGLVRMRADGTSHFYRLDTKSLETMAASALRNRTSVPKRGALGNFLAGERITQIPARAEKRRAVLEWLAGRFEPGVVYPEKEVNAILKRHHDDHTTLRRYLVDAGLLARSKGLYRRVT